MISFPCCLQCVPQYVPNSATLLSHMLRPKLNLYIYIHYKRVDLGGGGASLCFYFEEFPCFQKRRRDEPIKVASI